MICCNRFGITVQFYFRKLPIVPITSITSVLALGSGGSLHSRKYSVEQMAQPKWQIEKTRILSLPAEERRKIYKANYIAFDDLQHWLDYSFDNKAHLKERKCTQDDLTELAKIKIDEDRNRELATKVCLFQGDITKLEIGAIVNAANSALRAGGGVDGAIHKAAGPLLQDECKSLGGCPTGEARITGGYNLPAKYVIHTVGPQNGSAPNLQSCYEKSLACAVEYELKSIAFPCISTGIYGFPNRLAAHIALRTARKFLEQNDDMKKIIFCTFMPIDVEIYETLMQLYFPVSFV